MLRQSQLAKRWNMSTRTLERWRAENYGPPYLVLGGSIRYRLDDIVAFEAAGLRGTIR
ncbi:MAG: DNA-binding protein [Maritimibacter sp.]|nr:DNA-binding protein [Maritimibacter sp.]